MRNDTHHWLRPLSIWVIPPVVLVAVLLPPLLLFPRLPDPVAIHWGLSGEPNGNLPTWLWLAGASVLWVGHWLYLAMTDRAFGAPPSLRGPYSTAGVLVGLEMVILRANLDTPTWEEAETNVAIDLAMIALFAIAFSRGGRFLQAHWQPAGQERSAALRPSLGLGTTERAMWIGGARLSWWVLALGGGAAAVPALFTFFPVPLLVKGASWLVAIVLGGTVLSFSYISVRISSAKLLVKAGPWGRPRSIDLGSVREAQVIDVDPREFGGWGYRVFPGGTGFIMRSGEALLLRRQDANDLLVTVDDAAVAAGLVNDLIPRDAREKPLA